jgi:hypothetical protein
MRFVGRGALVGALLGVVFVIVLLAVAWLRPTTVPEQRAELVSVWAFLAAAPLSLVTDALQQNMDSEVGAGTVMLATVPLDWAFIGGIVGGVFRLLFARAVAGVKDWPRKRIDLGSESSDVVSRLVQQLLRFRVGFVHISQHRWQSRIVRHVGFKIHPGGRSKR